jgi:hypothetical protein
MGAKPTRCVEQPAFGGGGPASEMHHDALGAQSACRFRKARHTAPPSASCVLPCSTGQVLCVLRKLFRSRNFRHGGIHHVPRKKKLVTPDSRKLAVAAGTMVAGNVHERRARQT